VDDLMHEAAKVIEKGYRVLATTLTKKMAEDLTEYLHENGLKVRYMHSDIDTLRKNRNYKRFKIRSFDILVGINLIKRRFRYSRMWFSRNFRC
jgi:excinuclease ABC subunit B